MGTVGYMRAVRQRYTPQGVADETDENMEDDEPAEHGGEASASSPSNMESVTEIVDFLKMEHVGCFQRGELWDANAIQNLIFEFLQDVGEVHGAALTARCVGKVANLFRKLHERTTDQNRWQTADRYQRIVGLYEQY